MKTILLGQPLPYGFARRESAARTVYLTLPLWRKHEKRYSPSNDEYLFKRWVLKLYLRFMRERYGAYSLQLHWAWS